MRRGVLIILLAGLTQIGSAGLTLAQSSSWLDVPIYGNWCGPNHPENMSRAAPPVDGLDAACMRHDYCVAARGRFDCGCDIGLLRELRATRWPNPVMERNARGIYDAIAMVPCDSPDGMAVKQSMFSADLMRDVMTGRGTPMDVLDRWRRLAPVP